MGIAKQRAPIKIDSDALRVGERRCTRCHKVKRTDIDFDIKGDGRRYSVCRICRENMQTAFKERRLKAKEARDKAPKVSCWLRSPDSPVLSITMGAFYQTYFRMVTSRW